jgi:hypothetical protein
MDNPTIRLSMVNDAQELVARLACVLTLASDSVLQAGVRGLAGVRAGSPIAARLPASKAWLVLTEAAPTAIMRQPPPLIPKIELDDPFAEGGPLRADLLAATEAAHSFQEAYELLMPIFNPPAPVTRAMMTELLPWAPAFEYSALRILTHSVMLLDTLRPPLLVEVNAGSKGLEPRLQEYAGLLRTAADLQLFVADEGARPWLNEMAHSFEWRHWTPSWQFTRERVVDVLPAAAWSVRAFGPGVVDDYLSALLRSAHPMQVFDALFGLVALALSTPGSAQAIATEIRARKAFIDTLIEGETDRVAWMATSALEVIAEPEAAVRRLTADGFLGDPAAPGPLLRRLLVVARDHDPVEPLQGDRTPLALSALPLIFATDRAAGYPDAAAPSLAGTTIVERLQRAWIPASARVRQVVH